MIVFYAQQRMRSIRCCANDPLRNTPRTEILPYTARMVDDIAIVRSMHTEAINHEPAITFFQTGQMVAGRPCIGSWLNYGLGSLNQDLPAFVVLQAKHYHPKANVQAISARLWSAGFLSGQYAGVSLRNADDPVLFINNPEGVPTEVRRRMQIGTGHLPPPLERRLPFRPVCRREPAQRG